MNFENVFLKIDKRPKYYQHMCISFGSFVVERVFAIKRKNMAPTKESIKKLKQEFPSFLFNKTQKLVCALYNSQKEIIQSARNFNDTFIVDSKN